MRHAEEFQPSVDYIDRLLLLGPRDGETELTFRVRVATAAAGRRFIYDAWLQCDRSVTRALASLGYHGQTVLKQYGLSADVLLQLAARDQAQ